VGRSTEDTWLCVSQAESLRTSLARRVLHIHAFRFMADGANNRIASRYAIVTASIAHGAVTDRNPH
jgi:hypothetical protein